MKLFKNVARIVTLLVFTVIIVAEVTGSGGLKPPTKGKQTIKLPASVVRKFVDDQNAPALEVDADVFKNKEHREAIMMVLDKQDTAEFVLWLYLAGLSKK